MAIWVKISAQDSQEKQKSRQQNSLCNNFTCYFSFESVQKQV